MNIKEEAVKYLSSRPRTCKEMEKRLLSKGFEKDEITETVEELKELGYLNDREYAVMYLNYGFTKNKGIKLIKYELFEKGVSGEDIDNAISDYEEEYGYDFVKDERIRASEYAKKTFEGEIEDEKARMKLARRLSAKGYDSGTVLYVLSEMTGNGEDQDVER